MNHGKYVFSQLVEFIPKKVFDWIVMKNIKYLRLNRSTFDVLRILSMSLFDKTPIKELFERAEPVVDMTDNGQVQLSFNFYFTFLS